MATLYDAAGQKCWITVTQEFSTRSLLLDRCEEGAMRLDSEEPVFTYLWFHKCSHLAVAPVRKALVLGAGAGTTAKCLALDYPQADIDAVDLEPDLEMIGRKFFRLDQAEFSRIRFHCMHLDMLRSSLSPGGICVKNMIWDPFSANTRAACTELRERWTKSFPNYLGLAMGDSERGHNFLLVGTAADGVLAWPVAKEKLGRAGVPGSILDGIHLSSE